jgi:hypothetical protein
VDWVTQLVKAIAAAKRGMIEMYFISGNWEFAFWGRFAVKLLGRPGQGGR